MCWAIAGRGAGYWVRGPGCWVCPPPPSAPLLGSLASCCPAFASHRRGGPRRHARPAFAAQHWPPRLQINLKCEVLRFLNARGLPHPAGDLTPATSGGPATVPKAEAVKRTAEPLDGNPRKRQATKSPAAMVVTGVWSLRGPRCWTTCPALATGKGEPFDCRRLQRATGIRSTVCACEHHHTSRKRDAVRLCARASCACTPGAGHQVLGVVSRVPGPGYLVPGPGCSSRVLAPGPGCRHLGPGSGCVQVWLARVLTLRVCSRE